MTSRLGFSINMCAFACAFVVFDIFFLATAGAQQTIQVPGNAATVQAAINMANNGDTVNIAPGTYAGPINFEGKSITVQGSAPGVILEGSQNGPVVLFESGETRSAILQNVTVTNGSALGPPSAGGIFINGASPTIQNSTITGNLQCGIGVVDGAPAILNNEISGTVFTGSGCVPNTAAAEGLSGDGGGILLYGPPNDGLETQIIGNTIENNQMMFGGGGISVLSAGLPLIENNIITNNLTNDSGAGILVVGDTAPLIIQNLIYNNTINPTLTPPAFANVGAGLNVDVATGEFGSIPVLVVNNTIVGNQLLLVPPANSQGSQFYARDDTQGIQLYNNLIIGSTSQSPVECSQTTTTPPGAPASFYNNDVYDLDIPGTEVYGGGCTNQTGVSGNISADPLFATGATDAHPYELLLASPAVDAGGNLAPSLPSLDILGQPRIQNAKGLSTAIVDMGVYEYMGVPGPPPPPANFTLAVTPSSATVQQGKSANFSVTITPTAANLGAVILTCTGLPANAACTFTPSLLEFTTTGVQSSVLTVTTGAAVATSSRTHRIDGDLSITLAGLTLVPFLLGLKGRVRATSFFAGSRLITPLCLLCIVAGLSGCGKDTYIVYTPPQTYTFAVQASAVNSGLSKQAAVTLTVDR
jgi:Right handed beta helix region